MAKHYYYVYGKKQRSKRWSKTALASSGTMLLVLGLFVTQILPNKESAPVPVPAAQEFRSVTPTKVEAKEQVVLDSPISWPSYGNAAYAVPKDSLVATSIEGSSVEPVPIASLAKVITALTIMREMPLAKGDQGPLFKITEKDIAIYEDYVRKSGTVVPIALGQEISQYQALQAIMLPSSNNIADSLAIWAFGSIDAYTIKANHMLEELGFSKTTVADASGFSPDTVSTPTEMARLGYLYLKNPVLRQIVLQKQATIPITGTIYNYNSFINQDDIVGIKVGNTDEAGKCFLGATIRQAGTDNEEISVSVVLGANNLNVAGQDVRRILETGNQGHDKLAIEKMP